MEEPTKSNEPVVFVSYSHKDKAWLERLQVHLKTFERQGALTVRDDTKIPAGADWESDIERMMSTAHVAILLVSADFLASDYIYKKEIPRLIEEANWRSLRLLPIIVSPSSFANDAVLSNIQAVNEQSNPLISMTVAEREESFVRAAALVSRIIQFRKPIIDKIRSSVWFDNLRLANPHNSSIQYIDWKYATLPKHTYFSTRGLMNKLLIESIDSAPDDIEKHWLEWIVEMLKEATGGEGLDTDPNYFLKILEGLGKNKDSGDIHDKHRKWASDQYMRYFRYITSATA